MRFALDAAMCVIYNCSVNNNKKQQIEVATRDSVYARSKTFLQPTTTKLIDRGVALNVRDDERCSKYNWIFQQTNIIIARISAVRGWLESAM